MSARRFTSSMSVVARWRRRRMCVLVTNIPQPACVGEVSARGASIETRARPALGEPVALHHPELGVIRGTVATHFVDGITISFLPGEPGIAFALGALAADAAGCPATPPVRTLSDASA